MPVYQEFKVEGPKDSLNYLREIAEKRLGASAFQITPLENGNYSMGFVGNVYKPKDLSDFYEIARKRDSDVKTNKKSFERSFDPTDFKGD